MALVHRTAFAALAATGLLLSGCSATPAPAPETITTTSTGWNVTADDALAEAGSDTAVHDCPLPVPDSLDSVQVWGDEIYTSDSLVCFAALHAGAISAQTGGPVRITALPGQDSYDSSTRNGVTTSSWGSWGSSFSVAAP